MNEIVTIFISLFTSIITVYVLHTRLGCFIGIHQYKQVGEANTIPIEYHFVCLRCGTPKTVYQKEKRKKRKD
jgi:hypothetical protein